MTLPYLLMTQKELNLKSIMDQLIAWHILEREAAWLAHKSLRQIQRIKKRFQEEWDVWLIHKGRGHPSNHHIDPTSYDEAIRIISSQYSDYSYIMIYEKLRDKHNIHISMPTIRNELIRRGIRIVRKQRKKDIQRTMRERKESFWEMEQYDGSYHNWFEGRWWIMEACLLVSVDDASEKVFARFDLSEGIGPTFRFWREYISSTDTYSGFWKPKSIYLDRFSTYKINHPNATDDKELKTQFGRVCQELGITLIFANSPQGKWRVERMNGTLQDRLVKELREAGIPHTNTVNGVLGIHDALEEANIFLRDIFLPHFNAQFMVEARWISDLHIPLREDEKMRLDAIFSEQKKRKVQNDFTVRFEGRIYQLYRNKAWWSIVYHGEYVTIEKHMNTSIHIRNKNWNYLIAKELPMLPLKAMKLPLPPLISEDAHVNKLEYMTQLQESSLQKQTEQKEKRESDRNTLSLLRQQFYQVHTRNTKFNPHWIPTLT